MTPDCHRFNATSRSGSYVQVWICAECEALYNDDRANPDTTLGVVIDGEEEGQ